MVESKQRVWKNLNWSILCGSRFTNGHRLLLLLRGSSHVSWHTSVLTLEWWASRFLPHVPCIAMFTVTCCKGVTDGSQHIVSTMCGHDRWWGNCMKSAWQRHMVWARPPQVFLGISRFCALISTWVFQLIFPLTKVKEKEYECVRCDQKTQHPQVMTSSSLL